MEEIKNNQLLEGESSIDFGKIFKDLLKHKTLYFKVLPVALASTLGALSQGPMPLPRHCIPT